ncbi:MAG: cytochrome c oxidase subunit II [Bryobacteraceae bacterium]|nr:cytochrome c oxidase subunit II [Bryobacteraceae bacterium]
MRRAAAPAALAAVVAVLLLTGCAGDQSALDPKGPQAARIARMSWLIFGFGAAILAAVTVLFLNAIRRGPGEEPRLSERGAWRFVIVAGVAVPAVILFAFLAYSARTGNIIATPPPDDALTIQAVSRQWWWEFNYKGRSPSENARTANEIYIPAGRPVRFELVALDVIHSFWIPNLHGKMDMIPGRRNTMWLQADHPGVWRGQCAEFCGLQHALMAFVVVAAPEEEFQEWLARQASEAVEPADAATRRGREVFLGSSCVLCHSVRGTLALATVGPDLTHVGSRRTLAAGTTPNTRGHLGGWIADPHGIKPGNHMPATQLPAQDLTALIAYLESLR